MRVAFYCDDRRESGLGHWARCTALSNALVARGHNTKLHGFGDEPLGFDLVVVDSYALETADFERLARGAPLCVIDDLADRDLSAAFAVLNQNYGAGRLPYKTSGNAKMLLGPAFALLRKQFSQTRETLSRDFARTDNRVLVTLGGGEVAHALLRVLEDLSRVRRTLEITVLGMDAPAGFTSAHSIRFIRRTDEIAPLFAQTDLAITSAGVTALELSCLGVPMIAIALAQNQMPSAAALREAGLASAPGTLEEALPQLAALTDSLLGDWRKRAELSRDLRLRVDGLGAERAAQELEAI
ncbi:MAG: hypothetical protein GIW97_03805 [Candidatus Eremiobacteraeota bacterium]|nr:hypothetical protein [Candidatus Eremiobacteraeota bacterium]